MSDHRRIQRSLYRMLIDPAFAERIFAGDGPAAASTGLGAEDLALLRRASPAGVGADRDGKRRAQLLRNATSEFALSTALAERRDGDDRFAQGFLGSDELHTAVARDGRLPLAFADYAVRRAEAEGDPAVASLAELERAMACARRLDPVRERPVRAPRPGELGLAPRTHLAELPGGAFELATAVREALDAGRLPAAARPLRTVERETVLIQVAGEIALHRLPEVEVELLEPLVAALLRAAEGGLRDEHRAAFARDHRVQREDLDAFVAELAAEGLLVQG